MVADWVEIGSEKMRAQRKRYHLSAEEVARRMTRNGFRRGTRTYERWEREGGAPREALAALAPVLGLDLEQILIDQPTRVQWQQVGDVLAEVVTAVTALTQIADELRQIADELRPPGASSSQR